MQLPGLQAGLTSDDIVFADTKTKSISAPTTGLGLLCVISRKSSVSGPGGVYRATSEALHDKNGITRNSYYNIFEAGKPAFQYLSIARIRQATLTPNDQDLFDLISMLNACHQGLRNVIMLCGHDGWTINQAAMSAFLHVCNRVDRLGNLTFIVQEHLPRHTPPFAKFWTDIWRYYEVPATALLEQLTGTGDHEGAAFLVSKFRGGTESRNNISKAQLGLNCQRNRLPNDSAFIKNREGDNETANDITNEYIEDSTPRNMPMSEQALMTEVNGLSLEEIIQHQSKMNTWWGNEAEEKLREYAEAGYMIQEAASFFPDKSFDAVRTKAAKLGVCFLGQVFRPQWGDEAKEKLRQYAEAGYTIRETTSFFTDKSLEAVRKKAARLGLCFSKGEK